MFPVHTSPGNGYLKNSGLPSLFVDAVWETTAEGDYIVLMLQTARFLLKSYAKAKAGGEVPGPVSYLAGVKKRNWFFGRSGPAAAKSAEVQSAHSSVPPLLSSHLL